MSQAAAIRRRKQHANGFKHLRKLGRSIYKADPDKREKRKLGKSR